MDLEPKTGNLDDKFLLNYLSSRDFEPVLSLRLSRVNHACIANASHYYEEKTKTKVIHATKNIKGKLNATLENNTVEGKLHVKISDCPLIGLNDCATTKKCSTLFLSFDS